MDSFDRTGSACERARERDFPEPESAPDPDPIHVDDYIAEYAEHDATELLTEALATACLGDHLQTIANGIVTAILTQDDAEAGRLLRVAVYDDAKRSVQLHEEAGRSFDELFPKFPQLITTRVRLPGDNS